LVPWAVAHLQPSWIHHVQVRHIVETLCQQVEEDHWHDIASFVEDFDDAPSQALITEAAAEGRSIPNPALQLPDMAMKLRNAALEAELSDLNRQIGQPDLQDTQRIELLHRQQEIRQLRRQPLPPVG